MTAQAWRLMLDGASSAAWNMSVDEALLSQCAARGPTLRLYSWSEPSLSLGYRQAEGDWRERCRDLEIDLVRRISGGGAVWHGDDLTYAVVLPHGWPGVPGSMRGSYAWIRDTVLAALREAGLEVEAATRDAAATARAARSEVCFEASTGYEIELAGDKLVGSAQRRGRFGVLQHGSIRLQPHDALAERILRLGSRAASGTRLVADELRTHVATAFAQVAGGALEPGPLSLSERQDAEERFSARQENSLWIPSLSLRTARASADR